MDISRNIGKMLSVLLLLGVTTYVSGETATRQLAYIKVPSASGQESPFLGSADKMTFDETENYLYVIGGRTKALHIYDMFDPTAPDLVFNRVFSEVIDGLPSAIALCRSGTAGDQIQQVAIAFASRDRGKEGHVDIFRPYLRLEQSLPYLGQVTANEDPVALVFDKACDKFLVACEGLPAEVNDAIYDPLPHVNIFERTVDGWRKTTVNFQNANVERTPRYVFRNTQDSAHSILNDLEPSDITIDDDEMVYVTFMENNAIAKFALDVPQTVTVYGLGSKNWANVNSDTSDEDASISPDHVNLARHRIRSHYQPGAILNFKFGSNVYLATANTGAVKSYTREVEGVDFTEAIRAGNIHPTYLNPDMNADLRAEIYNNAQLGRLFVSSLEHEEDGWNSLYGHFDEIYMYGGRSWSLWDAASLSQQYDSGDDFEYRVMLHNISIFNGDCNSNSESPPQTLDTRSPHKGPEPSTIATTLFESKQIVAIGSGRMGGIWLYRVGESEAPGFPTGQFESYSRLGEINGIWADLYSSNDAGTPHIKDLKFVNSAGRTLLLALCSQMGAIAVHELYETSS